MELIVITTTTNQVKRLDQYYRSTWTDIQGRYSSTWYWHITEEGKMSGASGHRTMENTIDQHPEATLMTFNQWKQHTSKPQTHNNMTQITVKAANGPVRRKLSEYPAETNSLYLIDDIEAGELDGTVVACISQLESSNSYEFVSLNSLDQLLPSNVWHYFVVPITELEISYKL